NGLIEGFISGDHSGKVIEKLVCKKTLRELIKDPLSHGAYYAEYAHDFGSYPAKKTIFCPTWSNEKIINTIKEAALNPLKECKVDTDTICIIGQTKDNFKIEFLVTKTADNKISTKSVYPYFEKISRFKE
ncbi:EndoU domain-containing protein, partial [Candidatus Dependentiae bacterium]|nr:EndoU domain-containing protein [Candidatus Dependentiae bacterium]